MSRRYVEYPSTKDMEIIVQSVVREGKMFRRSRCWGLVREGEGYVLEHYGVRLVKVEGSVVTPLYASTETDKNGVNRLTCMLGLGSVCRYDRKKQEVKWMLTHSSLRATVYII